MDSWRRVGSRRLQQCRVLGLDRVEFASTATDETRDAYVIDAPDWMEGHDYSHLRDPRRRK